jgi:uncharacterized protein YfiM (DUF2279 family)
LAARKTRALYPEIGIAMAEDAIDDIAVSVESFHAVMAAAMAVWAHKGMARDKTPYFELNAGWVDLLNLEALLP